jgi:flavin-dependent thymidylate synthase
MGPQLHTASLDWITPDSERVVARHARVSTSDPDRDEYEKLLKYCIKQGHWSVFEQVCASFEIFTTRAISPQILRHKSFSFQETSQRYCDPLDVLEMLQKESSAFELRRQDLKNRQNSIEYEDLSIEARFRPRIQALFSAAQDLYSDMLVAGVAKECARNILPSCVPTRLHMMGTLRSWIFYVGLRGAPGTQKEHRSIVLSVGSELLQQLPIIGSAVLASAESNQSLAGWSYI